LDTFTRWVELYPLRFFEEAYNSNKPKLFNLIWGQCTEALKSKLRAIDGFDVTIRNRDPLILWRTILQLSVRRGQYDQVRMNDTIFELDCREMLTNIHPMRIDEDIGEFYQRFMSTYEVILAFGYGRRVT
jgi:hypothetical protein